MVGLLYSQEQILRQGLNTCHVWERAHRLIGMEGQAMMGVLFNEPPQSLAIARLHEKALGEGVNHMHKNECGQE